MKIIRVIPSILGYGLERLESDLNGTNQISIEVYLDGIKGPDPSKPCYACGRQNWKSYPDSDGIFCGTCHP